MRLSTEIERQRTDRTKLILSVLGVIGLLVASVTAYQLLETDQPASRSVSLPAAQSQGLNEFRFIERNILPGDVSPETGVSLSEQRFHQWNILPGDSWTVPVTSLQEYRFRDWNTLPGGSSVLVPPHGEYGARY